VSDTASTTISHYRETEFAQSWRETVDGKVKHVVSIKGRHHGCPKNLAACDFCGQWDRRVAGDNVNAICLECAELAVEALRAAR
jgi:hypothetical protein